MKPYKDIAAATATETSRSQRQKKSRNVIFRQANKALPIISFFSFNFGQSF